jgi:hypothetical protein
MSGWSLILALIAAALMLWFMIRTIRQNPQAFSKENIGKSFYTIGILTLIIVAVIAFCVMLLRVP